MNSSKQTKSKGGNGMTAAASRLTDELQRMKDNIGGLASSANDDLAAQLRRLQEDLGEMQQTVTDFGQAVGGEAATAASRMSDAGIDAASKLAADARDNVNSAVDDFIKFGRKNPGYVLGTTFGLGLVIGLLTRRR